MDGRGGCCIARYNGSAYDVSKVDRIMLRFRPIAPKPAVSGSCPPGNSEVYVKTGRGKRRYVKDRSMTNKKRYNNRKRKPSPEETDPLSKTSSGGSFPGGDTVVTLPLLPETPDRKESPGSENSDVSVTKKQAKNVPIWLSFDNHEPSSVGHVDLLPDIQTVVKMPQLVRMVGSCVTVERVTDTWVDGDGLGSSDQERMVNLKGDTCPGFISDGLNRVWWANKAYREMVGQVVDRDLTVWLVMKEWVSLPLTCQAFTCKVRVTCGNERSSLTVPCDVWRMDGGGFAWRLDVKTALCLGR